MRLFLACIVIMISAEAYSQTRQITLEPVGKKQYTLKSKGLPHGNYSGIAKVKENVYAIVSDKKIANREKAKEKDLQWFIFDDESRDMEGIVYCPKSNTVFISGEADQRILEYTLEGNLTGRELNIPKEFGIEKIEPNGGFEALTYNETTGLFWTTTEMPLLADGHESGILRLQSFNEDLTAGKQAIYRLDALEDGEKKARSVVHGVSDMIALDDGELIVMERRVVIKKRYWGSFCDTKLYLVNPQAGSIPVEKKLVYRIQRKLNLKMWFGGEKFANFEGMCFGPLTSDGEKTLILISDSQGGYKILNDYVKIVKIKE